jgi:hypothetical protein
MPQPGGLAALFSNKEDAVLKEPQREADVARCGLPYVVVKTATIKDVPGGGSGLSIAPAALDAPSTSGGAGISREDLAGGWSGTPGWEELPGWQLGPPRRGLPRPVCSGLGRQAAGAAPLTPSHPRARAPQA